MEKYNIDFCILTNNSILLHICQYIPENVIFIELIVNWWYKKVRLKLKIFGTMFDI